MKRFTLPLIVLALLVVSGLTAQKLYNGYPIYPEIAAPGTPASGTVAVYAKADGLLYSKDDAGAETLVSGGAGGGGSFDPMDTTAVYVRDEFMGNTEDSSDVADRAGELGWFIGITNGDVGSITGEANHPGILRLTTDVTDNAVQMIYLVEDQNGESIANVHNATFDSTFVFRLDSCTDSAIRIGFLVGNVTDGSSDNGVYVRYDSDVSATNWFLIGDNGASPEVSDTGTACSTGWNKFRLYSTAGGTVQLDINGSNVDSVTQLPSSGTSPKIIVQTRSGASVAKNLDVDFFAFSQTVTR